MLKFAYVMSALVVIAPPAVAQTSPAQAEQARDVSSADPSDVNRIVCKKEETVGSRLAAKKVCLTVKEWQERTAQDRDETDRVQRDTQTGFPGG